MRGMNVIENAEILGPAVASLSVQGVPFHGTRTT